jgi:hypothetical protein
MTQEQIDTKIECAFIERFGKTPEQSAEQYEKWSTGIKNGTAHTEQDAESIVILKEYHLI